MQLSKRGQTQVEECCRLQKRIIVRNCKLQRLLEEQLCCVMLALLHGYNAAGSADVAAGVLGRILADAERLSEPLFRLGELVKTAKSSAVNCKNLYERIFVSGLGGLRIKDRQSLLIHPLPEDGFRFQDSEFPSQFRVRVSKSCAFPMGLILALFQVAVHEGLVGMLISGLRAFPTITGEPASNGHAHQKREV